MRTQTLPRPTALSLADALWLNGPMKLFQYWDSGAPPPDVAEGIESVRELNPEFSHQLFDRDSAAWFIRKHVGERERDAFETLALPAAQADYFRFCALWVKGGVWVDADMCCLKPLSSLLADAPGGYMSMLANLLEMDILFVPGAQSPFFRSCLELVTHHIEARLDGTSWELTGPRVPNLIWAAVDPVGAHADPHLSRDPDFKTTAEARAVTERNPGAELAFANITRRHNIWTDQWLRVLYAAYKATEIDWRKWRGPIYVPAAERPD
jgi:mannosyltransferase OCH1-like enzyme